MIRKGKKGLCLTRIPELSIRKIIGIGVFLFLMLSTMASYAWSLETKKLAQNTMDTLKQQCVSFNKVVAADRTKSLFRLTDMMLDFSYHLAENNVTIDDDYLERYVDNMRLTGIALLDGNLILEASGYTRDFRDTNWQFSPEGGRYSDIVNHPDKIFTERLCVDGEYYDIAAVSRKDAPGMIIGFYQQPSGIISGIENDLESLLTGLQLERDGQYIISEENEVRAASDISIREAIVSENETVKKLSIIPKDDHLHFVYAKGMYYLGYRSGCEGYVITIYYPFVRVFAFAFPIAQ